MAKYCLRLGADVRVIGKANSAAYEGQLVHRDGFNVEVYTHWRGALPRALHDAIRWADVVHLHGTYAPHNIWAASLCEHFARPYIVTPHCGLSPERKIMRGRWRKSLFQCIVQRQHLQKAAAIHALTEEEATDILGQVRPKRLVVLPNGVDLDDFPTYKTKSREPGSPVRFGYLGRVAREKNVPALCRAFVNLGLEDKIELLIAGNLEVDDKSTRNIVPHQGNIRFVGAKYGEAKRNFLESIDFLVIPSLSEGFPVVAAEALACGTPIVATRNANLSYFTNSGSIILCEATVFGIERGLREALARRADWATMAAQSRLLVEQRLNWATLCSRLTDIYKNVKAESV